MKFLHLSDLHIGKKVNEFSMLEDQEYILEQILFVIDKHSVEAVWIAGDIDDKPVPSAEAVSVFDDFLTNLANKNIPVFMISGNHDSPERIAFGARLFRSSNIYVSPVFTGQVEPVVLQDMYGELAVYMLPFVKPATVRHTYPEMVIESYHDAVKTAIEHMKLDMGRRNVLVAHQFVTGALRCESEDISVGGVDKSVAGGDLAYLAEIDITGLVGHLCPDYDGNERRVGNVVTMKGYYVLTRAAGGRGVAEELESYGYDSNDDDYDKDKINDVKLSFGLVLVFHF